MPIKKYPTIIKLLMAIVMVFLLGMLYYRFVYMPQEIVLHIGLFAGSNWNVPAADSYAVVDKAISSFEKRHPGVKIVYVNGIRKNDYSEWLSEQVLKGSEPDVFMVLSSDFNLYARMGLLENLDGMSRRDSAFSYEAYYKAALDYGKYDKKQYALPFESVPTLMFVNKTLLQRAGIAIPANNWKWQDFIAICQKVTKDTDNDGVIDQFGCYDYTWQQAAISNDVKLFRDDGKLSYFSDNKMDDVIKFMMSLEKINQGHKVTAKEFDMGKVAFRPFTFAQYRTYKPYPWRIKKYSSFEWDCIKLPAGPDGKNISQLDTLLMAMSSRSEHKELAWAFLKELCYEKTTQMDILQQSEAMPVIKNVVESNEAKKMLLNGIPGDDKMNVTIISDVMKNAYMPPKFSKYNLAMLIADNEIKRIIEGNITLNNALNKVQKKVNDFLQN